MDREILHNLYVVQKRSAAYIGAQCKCSQNKVNYWLAKHNVKKRTISEAMYILKNPLGDPFNLQIPHTLREGILYGLGLGLYWGEGLKRGRGGVRLGNTDVYLVRKFIEFLQNTFQVEKSRLRFGLQIFSDISPHVALNYWKRELHIHKSQFYKVIVSKVRGKGTYTYRSKYGVIMVYFNNVRLKELICKLIDNL